MKKGEPVDTSRWLPLVAIAFLFPGVVDAQSVDLSLRPSWTQVWPSGSPAVEGVVAAEVPFTRQIVLFGGGTWVWDGTNWIPQSPPNNPDGRIYPSMAAASSRQLVLFGGFNGLYLFGDTWVWDGTNWTQKFPANNPGARMLSAMCSNFAHGKVVMFGGFFISYGGSYYYGDTWVWDGSNWTQKFPATVPAPRYDHAMAADFSGQVVMFGGTDDHQVFGETWVWDGSNWTLKFPAKSPSPRYAHAMAKDVQGKVVLFGGIDASGVSLADTWVWDGTNWTQESSTNNPSARSYHIMADSLRNQIVLSGGNAADGRPLGDTWVWGRSLR